MSEKKIRIYTRVGDKGQTALFSGDRVSKSDPRVAAYGTIDELNSLLGWTQVAIAMLSCEGAARLGAMLDALQHELFEVGADLATPPSNNADTYQIKRIGEPEVKQLEHWIDELETALQPLRAFILPGGSEAAARLHLARTVCRRAEREAVAALESVPDINPGVIQYLNRLNDLFFVMARNANKIQNRDDVVWKR